MENWRERWAYLGIIVVPPLGLLAYITWLVALFRPLVNKIFEGG